MGSSLHPSDEAELSSGGVSCRKLVPRSSDVDDTNLKLFDMYAAVLIVNLSLTHASELISQLMQTFVILVQTVDERRVSKTALHQIIK